MGVNNNIIGKKRDAKALEELAKAPWTARHLVTLKVFPSLDIAQRRLRILHRRGKVNQIGNVNLRGNYELLWHCGHLSNRQHEAEISEIVIANKLQDVRRLEDVSPTLRPDAEIPTGKHAIPWEHECSGKLNIQQIKDKMERYGDRHVIWTCPSESWLDKLARHAPTDNHLFTTYDLAVSDFTGEIWVDRSGQPFSLQLSV